ncbi:MAG: histidine phosphatase family protein [Ruminococcaceae bacterium]|nr:histidine phosphatase family protein [Oscillospiraceae bacterium]
MRIIFVRHGHPDYKNDCLTELGHKQAEAVSLRLKNEKIDKFYSSSCGRAYETAMHIAEGRNMEVEKLDFMREIGWGPAGSTKGENGYDPWTLSARMVEKGQSLMSPTWALEYPFNTSFTTDRALIVGMAFDKWLNELGYARDGELYRVGDEKYKTILLASHGGSSSAVLSRIFNLPMPFVSRAILPGFTAVTIISFYGEKGSLICPQIEIMNDARHIMGISADNIYGN